MREIPENARAVSGEMAMRRAQIEMRIAAYRDSATSSLLEVGRALNAAKDEGLVPHGQWGAWVAEHAWMSERTAQGWMQAARELPPGSPLEKLGIAKIRTLLTLPEGEREAFARDVGAERLTSRELDEKVRAARAERDEAYRVMGEQKRKLQAAEGERDEAVRVALNQANARAAKDKSAAVADAIARTRADVTREKQAEIDRLNGVIKSGETGRKRVDKLYGEELQRTEQLRGQVRELQERLQKAGAAADPEKEREIRLLRSQIASRDAALRQRECEIDRLSEELDAAQTAAMRSGMSGESAACSPAAMILSSIGALMASAGRAPGELARLQGLDAETREMLCGQARMVGQWAMQILAACGEGDAHA